MPFEPGDTFDRYTIEALLGEGGMGTVYRAYDPRLDRRVALKVLRTDRAEDHDNATDAAARMMREARVAAALEHANCVAIFDVGEHGGTRFIAMEFVDGSPLRRFVGDRSVPLEQKTRWLVDVARALSAAHKRGLIHRDVKPENVMVRADGTIKVLDFGIAKRSIVEAEGASKSGETPAWVANESSLAETAAGVVAGTPLYMAPEQIRKESLDARADQFSWGLVAYELLTGQHPFRTGRLGNEFLLAILNDAPAPIAQLAPGTPAVVQATVQRALSKSRGARFATMDDVVMALEPFSASMSGRSLSALAASSGFDSVKTELAMPVDAPWTRSRKKKSARAYAIAAAVAVACAAVGTLAVRSRARGDEGAATKDRLLATTDASDGRGLAMTAADAPSSRNADALAAYREGLQSFRAASFEAARQAFARAVALDPAMAAAHLRLALLASLVASETEARESFRRAVEFRANLAGRNQLLVDAFEPYLQREPSDVAECVRRLAAGVDERPDDAELRLFLGTVQFDAGDVKSAEASFDRAIALDPGFAQAWSYRGATQSFRGEFDEALASFDRCLAISIGATDCLWYRVLIHEDRGECTAVEADARTWIAKAPDDSYAYHSLARALFALGRGETTVRAALEQAWAHADAASRERMRLEDELKLAATRGDFVSAIARGAELQKALAAEPSAAEHARIASFLVQLDEETGHLAAAVATASDFLARRDAWVSPTRVDDIAISQDLTPAMLSVEAAGGKITSAELAGRREEWLRAWASKTSPTYLGHLWIYAYASSARTPADARAALEALPRYGPLPPFLSASLAPSLAIGRVYLLADRAQDALPALERAARSCLMLDEPLSQVQAELVLGRAREATGDTKGACDAYRAVVARWGDAKPRSTSSEEAKKRSARLSCVAR